MTTVSLSEPFLFMNKSNGIPYNAPILSKTIRKKNKFYNEVAMIYVAQKCGFEVKER